MSSKRLTLATHGRNDNHMGNFKYRLSTCINSMARHLQGLGRLEDIEFLVTDWNSEVPLCEALPLSPEAARICRFVIVPPEVARAKHRPGQVYNVPCAMNVALRRAGGEFAAILCADTVFPGYSVRLLLELLDGRTPIPFRAEQCLFLFGRKRIPWDVVNREPGLDELEEYMLIEGGQAGLMRGLPGLGVSVSAQMMHSSIWRACRGFDEELSFWGWSDAELTLRVCQKYPWIEAMSLGIDSFELDHYAAQESALKVRRENPRRIHEGFSVNDEDWGLGSFALDIRGAEKRMAAVPVLPPQPQPEAERWAKTRAQVIEEFSSPAVQDHVRSVALRGGKRRGGRHGRGGLIVEDSLGAAAAAWYSLRRRPQSALEFGFRTGALSAVIAAACPSAAIYAVAGGQEGGESSFQPLVYAARWFDKLEFQGYLRFITGDPATALARLSASLVKPPSLELVLMHGDLLGIGSLEPLKKAALWLAPGGAVIFTCRGEGIFGPVWGEFKKERPGFTFFQCERLKTGLALAAALESGGLEASPPPAEEDLLIKAWGRNFFAHLTRFRRTISSLGRFWGKTGRRQ